MIDPFCKGNPRDYWDGVVCALGGGSNSSPAPAQQTVVQSQQIPAYAQGFSQENMDLARSLGNRPFPVYGGPRIADFAAPTQQSFGMTQQAAGAAQPYLGAASNMTASAAQGFPQANIGAYMNPYIEQSLQPQLQDLARQQGIAQQGINSSATQAGAFGDARHGVADANNNYNYGQLASQMIGTGYNNAFNNAANMFQSDQQRQLAAGNQMGNIGTQLQTTGLQGANAMNMAGQQQQAQTQQNLTQAYNDFQNQQQYPIEQLNMRTSVLANSPYNTTRMTTQPPPNQFAQNLGAFSALAGGAGALTSGFK